MPSPESNRESSPEDSGEAVSALEKQLRDSCIRVLALTHEAHALVKTGQLRRVESILERLQALHDGYEQDLLRLGLPQTAGLWKLLREYETLIHGYRQSLLFTKPRVFKPGLY